MKKIEGNANTAKAVKICPVCGKEYRDHPAISRKNGEFICPDCGVMEALESIGISKEEREKILGVIHRHERRPVLELVSSR